MAEVEVRRSPIEGLGVFACERVPAGARVRTIAIEREVTRETPLRPERGERPEHCPRIRGRWLLLASPDRHYNHSCDPNAWKRFAGDAMEIVARRTIEPGDEITLDYLINNAGGDSWPCHCSAARCRGETGTSFFALPEEFRREYRPLLAHWFVAAHASQLGER